MAALRDPVEYIRLDADVKVRSQPVIAIAETEDCHVDWGYPQDGLLVHSLRGEDRGIAVRVASAHPPR